MLALTDGISGDESDDDSSGLNVFRRFEIPTRDVIKESAVFDIASNCVHVSPLRLVLELRADERRIAQHVAALLAREHGVPIHAERVALDDVR